MPPVDIAELERLARAAGPVCREWRILDGDTVMLPSGMTFLAAAEEHNGLAAYARYLSPATILALVEEVAALRAALPDPDKLELLADYLDTKDREIGHTADEVQDDLRLWATNIRALLARAGEEK